jgi:hypothetical protein
MTISNTTITPCGTIFSNPDKKKERKITPRNNIKQINQAPFGN